MSFRTVSHALHISQKMISVVLTVSTNTVIPSKKAILAVTNHLEFPEGTSPWSCWTLRYDWLTCGFPGLPYLPFLKWELYLPFPRKEFHQTATTSQTWWVEALYFLGQFPQDPQLYLIRSHGLVHPQFPYMVSELIFSSGWFLILPVSAFASCNSSVTGTIASEDWGKKAVEYISLYLPPQVHILCDLVSCFLPERTCIFPSLSFISDRFSCCPWCPYPNFNLSGLQLS